MKSEHIMNTAGTNWTLWVSCTRFLRLCRRNRRMFLLIVMILCLRVVVRYPENFGLRRPSVPPLKIFGFHPPFLYVGSITIRTPTGHFDVFTHPLIKEYYFPCDCHNPDYRFGPLRVVMIYPYP
ncbi:MAG: hypothetical protein ACYTDW_21080 [Planctomycetota bacterium]|jgi:hypothetical protein